MRIKQKRGRAFQPDSIAAYFRLEWLPLTLITLSGLAYNVGLLAGPWFEGRLAQCLADILGGRETAAAMTALAAGYILVTLLVQAARFIKRFYVRRFANNINRRMKGVLYANLVRQSRGALEKQGAGELMTKAISDVDDCAEGIRKFTTEVFDTGVALAGYIVMLFAYDRHLALLCMIFPPISYICAEKMKKPVQRAEVSWKRIKPMMKTPRALEPLAVPAAQRVEVSGVSFCYDGGAPIFEGVSFSAQPGDIIGVTGPVACGKSTLGRVFLGERPYGGSVRIGGRELSELSPREAASTVGYLGHDPELWNDTVEENVRCGEAGDAMRFLALTALDGEVRAMEQGLQTVVGSGGVRLSGGQAQRLALARTLAHPRPVLVLDDPFSALDRQTEDEVFARLKACAQDRVVILISHRLYHFPQLKQIVFMQGGKAAVGTHEALCASVPAYRALYESQTGGAAHEA